MQEWTHDAIFDVECPTCGYLVEFYKDDITRTCHKCKATVVNDRKDYGCKRWCSLDDPYKINVCPKFSKSKRRFKL